MSEMLENLKEMVVDGKHKEIEAIVKSSGFIKKFEAILKIIEK